MSQKPKHVEPVLTKVVSRDDLGRVRSLEVVYDHETVDLRDPANREFIIFWLEKGLMQKLNTPRKTKNLGS